MMRDDFRPSTSDDDAVETEALQRQSARAPAEEQRSRGAGR